jgi:hypothetical protein
MENNESKGLGDDIEKITHALKLDTVAEKVANLVGKKDCGCNKRRDALNKMFPHKNNNSDESK